ncbi:phosphate transport system regulatory protein PhoU [Pseudofulvimonas gallinarii]|nr:phosphate transport system regulatory protein PhoU [Pseudofulvimonas gallinarii]
MRRSEETMSTTDSGHTVKKFDEELASLRGVVLRMGGLVEEQLRRALKVLADGDAEGALDVIKGDLEIDLIELRSDQEIAQLLARRSPLGVDLRTVLMLSKSVTDIERIGDETKKVARICVRLPDNGRELRTLPYMHEMQVLGEMVSRQLAGALDALARLDLARADEIRRNDDAVDAACNSLLDHIAGHMQEAPHTIPAAVLLLFATRALERIGDHTKNLTQYAVYLVEGRDVRHRKAVRAARA